MDPQHLIYDEITRLQQRLLEGLDAIPRIMPALLGLEPRHAPPTASLRLPAQSDAPTEPNTRYHQGHFGARHGLSPAEAWQAEQLLRQKPPFRGRFAQQKEAARIRGIITAVKAGRVANSAFGRSLHGHRGGNVIRDHAKSHLRAISLLGAEAAKSAKARRKAMAHFEHTGEVLPLETETDQSVQALDMWAIQKSRMMPFMMW